MCCVALKMTRKFILPALLDLNCDVGPLFLKAHNITQVVWLPCSFYNFFSFPPNFTDGRTDCEILITDFWLNSDTRPHETFSSSVVIDRFSKFCVAITFRLIAQIFVMLSSTWPPDFALVGLSSYLIFKKKCFKCQAWDHETFSCVLFW